MLRSRCEEERARATGEVARQAGGEPTGREQDRGTARLIVADLDRRQASGFEQARQLLAQLAQRVEAVLAGEQGLVRLMLGDARAQWRRGGDIGRVAQDQVEPFRDAVRPIADPKLGAGSQSKARDIPPGIGKRRIGRAL